jgi:Outer membrane protein beta-barrel domain
MMICRLLFACLVAVPAVILPAKGQLGRTSPTATNRLVGGGKVGGLLSMPQGSGLRTLPFGAQRVAFSSTYGALGGGVARYEFGPELALQTELSVSTRGFTREYYFLSRQQVSTFKVRQICLELPLLVQYHASAFFVEGGLTANLALRSTYEQVVSNPQAQSTRSGTLFDASKTGISATIGVGVELPEGVFFDLRYLHGLTAMGEAPPTPPTEDIRMEGQNLMPLALQASVGYLFRPPATSHGKPLTQMKKSKKRRR